MLRPTANDWEYSRGTAKYPPEFWRGLGVRSTNVRQCQEPASPAHSYFGQLLDSDGTVLLCLLLFFRVDDFDAALQRARGLVERLEEEPHTNPHTGTREFSLRDLDGYFVTISAL
jgi:hypothetical protein